MSRMNSRGISAAGGLAIVDVLLFVVLIYLAVVVFRAVRGRGG